MSLFSHANSLAITWDAHERCRAVLVESHGNGARVLRVWHSEPRGKRDLAELVQEGVRELGATADTAIIVGGNSAEAAIFDVRMPKMKTADLRGAVEFRLGAQVPVGVDEIFWGYRLTEKTRDQLGLRVAYLRREEWEHWLEAASGSPLGVDALIPATAVLDPLLDGRAVSFEAAGEDACFLLEPAGRGGRTVRLAKLGSATAGAFGCGETPLQADGLELGPLATASADEQRAYAATVALAWYGVSDAMGTDRAYWPQLPVEMRPKRNRILKYWTAGVAIYLVFVLTFLITSHLHRNHNRLTRIENRAVELRQQIQALESGLLVEDPGDALAKQFDESGPQRVSMVKTLAHLSALTSDELWMTSFTWDFKDTYNVRMQLRAEQDSGDLIQSLKQTPLLRDMVPQKNVSPGGDVTFTIQSPVSNPDDMAPLPPLPKVQPAPVPEPEDEEIIVDDPDEGVDAGGAVEDDALAPPPPPPLPPFPGQGGDE